MTIPSETRATDVVHAFTPFIPIRTIDAETRMAQRLVADGGFRFV